MTGALGSGIKADSMLAVSVLAVSVSSAASRLTGEGESITSAAPK